MSLGIGGVTSKAVEFALDGLSLRHDAIAANIANVNTVGYRPVQVSFEESISALIDSNNSTSSQMAMGGFTPELTPHISYANIDLESSVQSRIDTNTVLLNQNVLQYEALIKGLDKYISSIALAINDGRR